MMKGYDFRVSSYAALVSLLLIIPGLIIGFLHIQNFWIVTLSFSTSIVLNFFILLGYFLLGQRYKLTALQIVSILLFLFISLKAGMVYWRFFSVPPGGVWPFGSFQWFFSLAVYPVVGIADLYFAKQLVKLAKYSQQTKPIARLYRIGGWLRITLVFAIFAVITDIIATIKEIKLFKVVYKQEKGK